MAILKNRAVHIISLTLLALALAACSGGSDGSDGSAGPAGPVGPPGPPGPTTGTGLPIASADRINIDVTEVAVPAGGGAPTVKLTLTNDLGQGLQGL
ncbi:MAG: hypothetical protein OEV58_15745, partial [Gammaproteobacteria bacterium]|nr:hypothetical protein [Gammaproteobacteria bacterium]